MSENIGFIHIFDSNSVCLIPLEFLIADNESCQPLNVSMLITQSRDEYDVLCCNVNDTDPDIWPSTPIKDFLVSDACEDTEDTFLDDSSWSARRSCLRMISLWRIWRHQQKFLIKHLHVRYTFPGRIPTLVYDRIRPPWPYIAVFFRVAYEKKRPFPDTTKVNCFNVTEHDRRTILQQ